jgi:hypothetical protein
MPAEKVHAVAALAAPFREHRFVLLAALVVSGTMALQATQDYPTGLFDLYPLYYGAKAWLVTGSAYDLRAVAPPPPPGVTSLLDLGNAYPFPAIFFVLPLTALTPALAGIVWTGLLALSLVGAIRLVSGAWWLLLYLPLVEAVRIEQFTALIVAMQVAALWCLRHDRRWWLGLLECLIMTKPNHGALFVVVLLLLGHNWKQFMVWSAVVWGGSLLASPAWPMEWLPIALNNVDAVPRPVYWQFAVLLVPLVIVRDWISISLVAPVLLGQFRDVYVAAALPLGVVDMPHSMWLAPTALLWVLVSTVWDPGWGTALMLVLPVVAFSCYRWRRPRPNRPHSTG